MSLRITFALFRNSAMSQPSPSRFSRGLQLVVGAVGEAQHEMIEALDILLLFAHHGKNGAFGWDRRIEEQLPFADKDSARHLVIDRRDETKRSRPELKRSRITLEGNVFYGYATGL
jgi:hypothetical protein